MLLALSVAAVVACFAGALIVLVVRANQSPVYVSPADSHTTPATAATGSQIGPATAATDSPTFAPTFFSDYSMCNPVEDPAGSHNPPLSPAGEREVQRLIEKCTQSVKNDLQRLAACPCPRVWKPVCSVEGGVLPNSCYAKCIGTEYTEGECMDMPAAD